MHFHRKLEQIIQSLRLRLRLRHILTPHIHPVPPDQHSARLRPLLNCLLQRLPQILFVRCIVDDGNPHGIEVAQVTDFAAAFCDLGTTGAATGDAFDLLDLVDAEDRVGLGVCRIGLKSGFADQSHEDGPLGVSVDAAAGVAMCECCQKERGAG